MNVAEINFKSISWYAYQWKHIYQRTALSGSLFLDHSQSEKHSSDRSKLSSRISHNSHRQTIHLIISQHLCSGGPRVDKGVVTSLMEILRIPLMTNLETIYHLVFFLTLLALRGLCLQACYQCLVDSSFYIPRLPYLLISFYNFILFLAFPPHPMPIPHFYPFFPIGFCPVEPVDRLYPISRSDFHLQTTPFIYPHEGPWIP